MYKREKYARILDIYVRFCEGKIINKSEEAQRFGVDERTIQRDVDDIRAFINNYSMSSDTRCIKYSRSHKGYMMKNQKWDNEQQ